MATYREKISALPLEIRNFVISDTPMIELKKSLLVFGVKSELSPEIAKEIGLMYVKDLRLSNLPEIIKSKLGVSDNNLACAIAYEINRRIFYKFYKFYQSSGELLEKWRSCVPDTTMTEQQLDATLFHSEPWIKEMLDEKSESAQKAKATQKDTAPKIIIEKLSLSQALEKYPAIGDQQITQNQIQLKQFPNPVQPSIKNWIAGYQELLGIRKHAIMERGNFVFHSANTKDLSTPERQKLATVLKSLDEDMPLAIDSVSQKIIFPENKDTLIHSEENPSNQTINNLKFTPKQRFPFEKTTEKQTAPQQSTNSEKTTSKNNVIDLKNISKQ